MPECPLDTLESCRGKTVDRGGRQRWQEMSSYGKQVGSFKALGLIA